MNSIIHYRIFYWIPNTLSDERIAIGLCLFDKELHLLDTHWIAQKELSRLQNIFDWSSKSDSKDVLNMLNEVDGKWKSKAFNSSFWHYIERYWNGIVQISDNRKLYYEGTATDFKSKSKMLKEQFLPLANLEPKYVKRRSTVVRKNFERYVKQKGLEEKVSLGIEIPRHSKYRLLKSINLDLGTQTGYLIGSTGFDFSLVENTLIKNAHSYFDAFQTIRKTDGGGDFSFVINQRGNPYDSTENQNVQFYDDFRFRCDDLKIRTLGVDEVEDFVNEISAMPNLKPLAEALIL